MATWYKTGEWGKLIATVEVIRETEAQVVVVEEEFGKRVERRRDKVSRYDNYFPTFDKAKIFLLQKYINDQKSHQIQIDGLQRKIEEVQALEEPKERP